MRNCADRDDDSLFLATHSITGLQPLSGSAARNEAAGDSDIRSFSRMQTAARLGSHGVARRYTQVPSYLPE